MLLACIEGLRVHLNREQREATTPNRRQPARADFIVAAVTDSGRHYRAGRALYPVGGDPERAARRAALDRAATDVYRNAASAPASVRR